MAKPMITVVALLALALPAGAAELPVQRGFYVRAGTPCSEASNATITLVHKSGINSARTQCEFTSLTQLSAGEFYFAERCSEIGGDDEVQVNTGRISVLEPGKLRVGRNDGWIYEASFCAQSAMPEIWRDNDISDMLN